MTEIVLHGPGNGRTTAGSDESAAFEELREIVRGQLKAATDTTLTQARTEDVDAVIQRELDAYARRMLRAGRVPLDEHAETRVRQALHDAFTGAGGLEALLNDPTIETINIDGFDNVFVIRRDGAKDPVGPVAGSDAELEAMFRDMAAAAARRGGHERRFDRAEPELSLQLPNGARMHALMDVSDRICASIRLFPPQEETLDELVRRGELTRGMAALFDTMVKARRNIIVSGGPAAGKTTLLGALGSAIPRQRRVIVIEDTSELRFNRAHHPDLVRIQTRMANTEGAGEFDMSRALRASLRMSPDVVIVGEVRGAEVVWMAKAMSIGIDGSMCTVHASDSAQTLLRMIAYAMEPPAAYTRDAAVALLASAVHFVIHLDFTRDGTRVVSSVREVVGTDGDQIISNEVYAPGPDKRAVPTTQLRTDTLDQLVAAGFDPAVLHQDRW
jgi:Flp pilus assembly CpaF family ATPase